MPGKRGRAWLFGIAAAVIAAIAVVAAIASRPRSKAAPPPSSSTATVTTVAPPTTLPTPATAGTTVTAPARLTALARLQPRDVDPAKDCSHNQSPPTGLVGVIDAQICGPRNLPGGQLFSFQFDNAADFAASVVALNKFKGFDPPTAGSACPPGSNPQGAIGWHSSAFPSLPGQDLECLSVGNNNSQPDYIWSYPTENVVMDAQAAPNSTFTALHDWWASDTPPGDPTGQPASPAAPIVGAHRAEQLSSARV